MKKHPGLAHNFPLIPPAFVNKTQAAFVLGSVTFLKRAMHAKLLTVSSLTRESVKVEWSNRAAVLRKNLDALYAKYREALRAGKK